MASRVAETTITETSKALGRPDSIEHAHVTAAALADVNFNTHACHVLVKDCSANANGRFLWLTARAAILETGCHVCIMTLNMYGKQCYPMHKSRHVESSLEALTPKPYHYIEHAC